MITSNFPEIFQKWESEWASERYLTKLNKHFGKKWASEFISPTVGNILESCERMSDISPPVWNILKVIEEASEWHISKCKKYFGKSCEWMSEKHLSNCKKFLGM